MESALINTTVGANVRRIEGCSGRDGDYEWW